MKKDSLIYNLVQEEKLRQLNSICLIASENFASLAVRGFLSSELTNKYSEGYPNRRYYRGCTIVDKIESLAIERVKRLFSADHANVQPHSGTQANQAAYYALLQNGNKILSMSLKDGGHLTHGSEVNFSGRNYQFKFYNVNSRTGLIDYEKIEKIAHEFKPHLIIAGASSYSREIDFKQISKIAKKNNSLFMADIAHTAGLIAAGLHSSPVPFADVVTFTTQKTMRGPRGGIILCKKKWAAAIDAAVFPGNQGGSFQNVIASKAQCFYEALSSSFVTYQQNVIKNSRLLAEFFIKKGTHVITKGTDNHMFLLDVKGSFNISGKEAALRLENCGIICNKNLIPRDKEKPWITSGIRIGTAAMTTLGFKDKEWLKIGNIIFDVLKSSFLTNQEIFHIKLNVKRLIKNLDAKLIEKFFKLEKNM